MSCFTPVKAVWWSWHDETPYPPSVSLASTTNHQGLKTYDCTGIQ
uniref:Uncharacterized protein n=1 Tax=Arundo donax TaxID=35708 RepID=A0A0A9DPW8_ARUDO